MTVDQRRMEIVYCTCNNKLREVNLVRDIQRNTLSLFTVIIILIIIIIIMRKFIVRLLQIILDIHYINTLIPHF